MKGLNDRLKLTFNYQEVAAKGPVFVDSKFPANNNSLGNDPEMQELIKRKIKWKRALKVCSKFKLFRGVDIEDVIQGDLGDCYFLSAITSVSENPNRILKLFLINKENKHGCYAISLYICGALRTIVLDDYFPILGNTWALTHSNGPELWVMLLEKAWAKAHGNYGITSGGDSRESLSALTGAPTTLLRHRGRKKMSLWTSIFNATKRKYIMVAGGAKRAKGLYSSHAYSLLRAMEVNTKKGVVRLVQIRNPWGEYEWNGDWSDSSELWTPELRLKLGHVVRDDGTFFMTIEDFYTLFGYTFICQCVDSYIHTDVIIKEHEACVAFELFAETKGFFSAHQATSRMMNNKDCKALYVEMYMYKDHGLEIVKPGSANSKALDFSHNPAGSDAIGTATLEVTLQPGLYVMHAFYLRKKVPSVKYICFSSYASKRVDLVYLKGKTSIKSISKQELLGAIKNYIMYMHIDVEEIRPVAGTSEMCMNNHILTYSDATEPFKCDLCRKEKSGERYSCAQCKYDVCIACRGTTKVSSIGKEDIKNVSKHNISTCPEGHNLVCKRPSNLISPLSICSACGRVSKFTYARWICEPCMYYLCSDCKMPTVSEAVELNATVLRCLLNHGLKFDYVVYPGNAFTCDKCDRQAICTKGRWHCSLCNYDLCSLCASPPMNPTEENLYQGVSLSIAASVVNMCDNNHMLWYSTYSYLTGIYECNKCLRQWNCSDGRWLCFQCEYDICPVCRNPPKNAEKYTHTCISGHIMILSSRKYNNEDEYYRCSYCRKLNFIEESRWWCPICNYDICLKCIKISVSDIVNPEPIKKEERRCKDKHEFIKNKEETQSFICEEEDRPARNQASYKCSKCGMVQCSKCAAKTGKIIKEPIKEPSKGPAQKANENSSIWPTVGKVFTMISSVSSSCFSGINWSSVEVCGVSCNIM
jgi:hypothetical protein